MAVDPKVRRRQAVEAQRRWARAHPERAAHNDFVQGLKKRFGMTLAQYQALFSLQNGACAICFAPPGRKRLAVDHCHETGRIRGLLCESCNNGLGRFKDDPERLTRAATYLKTR